MYATPLDHRYRHTRAAFLFLLAGLSSCASWGQKEAGAVLGAATGGVVGAAIGKKTGKTAEGALIGAAVGGTVGAIIGHQMDQQAKELAQNIPGATVTRVGEGIAITFASGLLYDVDSDVIKADAAANLRNLAASVNKYPNTDLLIVGHTDATGSEDHNQALSERRARAAATYLGRQGVSSARLRSLGRGETEAIASNDTADGRSANRRVEIAIVASESARRQR
jgi:outer membrane protein OmpA-like peptidoglycan-associated protein